jgi:hypothetical protein
MPTEWLPTDTTLMNSYYNSFIKRLESSIDHWAAQSISLTLNSIVMLGKSHQPSGQAPQLLNLITNKFPMTLISKCNAQDLSHLIW